MAQTFTDAEKKVATQLMGEEQYVALIEKVFLQKEDALSHEIIIAKSDKELGEITRGSALAEMKVQDRWNRMKTIAAKTGGKPNPAAKS